MSLPSPTLPADIKSTLPDPNSSLCGNFVNALIKLPVLIYRWFAWAFTSTGTGSKNFVNITMRTGSLITSACLQSEDGIMLLCDGRDVSQTTYPDLYASLGATYGASTAGNFKIPDFRGRFPCGIGAFAAAGSVSLGVARGVDQVILVPGNLPPHDHSDGVHKFLLKAPYAGSVTGSDTVNSGSEQAVGPGDGASIQNVGSSTPFNIVPPTLGVFIYIVC